MAHEELVRIHELLSPGQKAPEGQQDKLHLLRNIVEHLREENKRGVDRDDSLAFPREIRSKLNLSQANQLWRRLDEFNKELEQDYASRRKMMLRRLDSTVKSFKQKGSHQANKGAPNQDNNQNQPKEQRGKAKVIVEQINERYDKIRATIPEEPQVSVADLLALRQRDCDRLLNSVVSSKNSDCKISYGSKGRKSAGDNKNAEMVNLKQVMIPDMPDRGGRVDEHSSPPRESFGRRWGRGRGGGGHSKHRGGHQRR